MITGLWSQAKCFLLLCLLSGLVVHNNYYPDSNNRQIILGIGSVVTPYLNQQSQLWVQQKQTLSLTEETLCLGRQTGSQQYSLANALWCVCVWWGSHYNSSAYYFKCRCQQSYIALPCCKNTEEQIINITFLFKVFFWQIHFWCTLAHKRLARYSWSHRDLYPTM